MHTNVYASCKRGRRFKHCLPFPLVLAGGAKRHQLALLDAFVHDLLGDDGRPTMPVVKEVWNNEMSTIEATSDFVVPEDGVADQGCIILPLPRPSPPLSDEEDKRDGEGGNEKPGEVEAVAGTHSGEQYASITEPEKNRTGEGYGLPFNSCIVETKDDTGQNVDIVSEDATAKEIFKKHDDRAEEEEETIVTKPLSGAEIDRIEDVASLSERLPGEAADLLDIGESHEMLEEKI